MNCQITHLNIKSSTLIAGGFIIAKRFLCAALIFTVLLTGTGCNLQTSDKSIKADILAKTKSDLNFAGVNYTVEGGIVTLTGTCPSEKAKQEAEKTIQSINVIKGIRNQIQIAPVIINTDLPLKQAVDSVLAGYPAVQAVVVQNAVILKGKAKKDEASKLMPAINKLHPAKVENQLMVQ